jgi:serine/threonine protein kinase
MRRATSGDGLLVVLKLVSDRRKELEFLEYFHKFREPANHTIPLNGVIRLDIGKTIIALPWKSPLTEVLPHISPECVLLLCLQFIEGVGFLHKHNVAHRDLKPANIVVERTSSRLFIIDLDLAINVEGEEEMSLRWCGTPPWIAPEVGTRSIPLRRYSPLLADRWVCGRLIEHFANYFSNNKAARELVAFAERLLNSIPQERPSLDTFLTPTPKASAKRRPGIIHYKRSKKRHILSQEPNHLSFTDGFLGPYSRQRCVVCTS